MKLFFLISLLAFLAFVKAEDCNCRLKTENRIVNGEFVNEHSIPWMASISVKPGIHVCGGAIMNERFILTAAHCVQKMYSFLINVRVGIHNTDDKVPKNKVYSVKKIHFKGVKKPREPGDIAILELKKNITFFDGVIEKGCFDLNQRNYPGELLVAGWGETEKKYKALDTQHKATRGRDNDLKQAFLVQLEKCEDFLICSKSVTAGDAICNGDGGSPLHYTENGITKIVGVTSIGLGYKTIDNKKYDCIDFSAFSRLSYYADWISETAQYGFCGTRNKLN